MGSLRPPRVRTARSLIPAVLVSVALLGALLVVLIAVVDPFGEETIDRSGPALLERMRELEEFTAAEATFTQDVDIERNTSWVPDFLKGERVVAIVTGSVRGVVDFGGLDEDSVTVSDDRRTIRIVLPDPVLSDAEIEESSARIVSRDRGIIDRVSDVFASNPSDDGPLFRAAEEKVAAAARDSDLVDQARANTERWMRTFLGAAGFDAVEISWQSSPT